MMRESFTRGHLSAWIESEADAAHAEYLAALAIRLQGIVPDEKAREIILADVRAWQSTLRAKALARAVLLDAEEANC